MPMTRRRSSREEEPETEQDERPTRRRRSPASEESDEKPTRRKRSEESEPEDEKPTRRGRRSSSKDEDEDATEDKPRRGRRSSADEGGSRRRRGSRGFGSFDQKRAKSSSYADDFKPGADNPTLIKFLEEEPFDSFNQHWIESRDLPRDVKRNSYMCLDDEYFEDTDDFEEGCPLCEVGEPAKTYSLFNVLDFTNPRKPEVKVWTAPPGVSEKLKRASQEKKSSPLDREDLYFEVELVKSKNKSEWTITPVKARDLEDDFDMTPLDAGEIEDFKEHLFEDRSAVTKVDSFEDLADLADSLD